MFVIAPQATAGDKQYADIVFVEISVQLNIWWRRIEGNSSKTSRQKQVAENNWSKILGGKLVEKQLSENAPAENSSQEQKITWQKWYN